VAASGGNVCQSFLDSVYASADQLLANMKVITSIYLNCRPDLRDEWLTGTEVDDVSDAQVCLLHIPSHVYDTPLFRHKSKRCASS
jgi:hypothetical protein